MRDLINSAFLAIGRRWRRNLMSVTAVLIGAGTLVTVIGANECAAQNLADSLNKLQSTIIVATLPSSAWSLSSGEISSRAATIPGVLSAGTLTLPNSNGTQTATVGVPRNPSAAQAPVLVADGGGLAAHAATFVSGGILCSGVQERDTRQAIVGITLARQLGLSTEEGSNTLVMNGSSLTVVGIVRDNPVSAALDLTVIVPLPTAQRYSMLPQNRVLAIQVEPGTADSVGSQLPLALYPVNPQGVSVSVSPTPAQLKEKLLSNSRTLVSVIAAVMVVATFFSAATTMQVAVWERRREIGIQRALGESRARVGVLFLTESMLLSFVGASAGWLLGILLTASIAWILGWLFVLPLSILAIPLAGAVVGALAGAIPAWRSTRVDPAILLRSD